MLYRITNKCSAQIVSKHTHILMPLHTNISCSIIPVRSPRLWSESIHEASLKHPAALAAPNAPISLSLQDRRMHDSFSELTLPFSSSSELLEQYINANGGLRTGRLIEHLDSLAGSIAYKHMLGPGVLEIGKTEDRGFYVVTAAVDR